MVDVLPRLRLVSGPIIGHGWNTLPLGAGGLINGFDVAPDGTLVCWTDVGNVYRWTGTIDTFTNPSDHWVPLVTFASMGAGTTFNAIASDGSIAMAIAYSQTTRMIASLPDKAGVGKWWVYYSNDSGATWTQSNLDYLNADSAGARVKSFSTGRLVFDPNNANYAYAGTTNAAKGAALFRSTDGGATWSSVGGFADTSREPGCCGITFDTRQGTIVNGAGATVTKRIIAPIGGVGMYESTDGGDTWSEIFNTPFGSTSWAPFKAQMDYDGVYYILITTNTADVQVWRYSGPTPSVGPTNTWVKLGPGVGSFYPTLPSAITNGILIVDPRNGHQGTVTVSFNSGIGCGYNSTNANIDTAASVTWTGSTTVSGTSINAPSYDVGWQADLSSNPPGGSIFLAGTEAKIVSDGRCLWSGFRGFWQFPAMPNYGPPSTTSQTAIGRGIEETVSEYVCCPPGGTFPVMATQDVGVMRGTFTSYPQAFYPPHTRTPAFFVDYAASDASYMVARSMFQFGAAVSVANIFGTSGYNPNYGASGEWVPYPIKSTASFTGSISVSTGKMTVTAVASGTISIGQSIINTATFPGDAMFRAVVTALDSVNPDGTGTYSVYCIATYASSNTLVATWGVGETGGQPDGAYNAIFTGSISNGSGGSGTILDVSSVTYGRIQLGQTVYSGGIATNKGVVTAFGTGTGGTGTYTVSTSSLTTSTLLHATRNTQGGVIVAVDHDHHIMVPDAFGADTGTPSDVYGAFVPVYTDNATGACTWQFCGGLPSISWRKRSAVNGDCGRPLAVGYGSELGYVYAAASIPQVTVTGAANNGSGAIRLTVSSTTNMADNRWRTVNAVGGVTAANGIWQVTVIDSTHIDLQGSTFSGTYTSGGTINGCDVYKSTDSGANFSFVGSVPFGPFSKAPLLFTVPGYPGHIWLTCRNTSGAGANTKLWRSTDSGATWSTSFTTLPGSGGPCMFCLGAPQTPGGYPTLFLATWAGNASPYTIYYSTNGDAGTVTWSVLGATGQIADLPPSCEIKGLNGIMGDWNVFKRLYGVATPQGYAYYNE